MMRRGNKARAMVRQRMRRPRRCRCQAKNSAETISAAKSDVIEKCDPSENSSLPSCPKKYEIPAEKSNGNSRDEATGPMSYRRVKIALGDAPKSRLAEQIRVFRMLGDVAGDERAERLHRQALRAHDIEQASYQRGADAAAIEFLGNFGVHDNDRAAVAPVVRKRHVTVGVELETVAFGVVANVIGHGHDPCTIMLHRNLVPKLPYCKVSHAGSRALSCRALALVHRAVDAGGTGSAV